MVFDSGVGGLSIVQTVRQRLPEATISYGSDNAAFPYGTKTEAELRPRVVKVLERFCQHLQPDIVVIACNSASTLALDALRAALPMPVVGVVPAIKPAAALSASKVIGLLATPGTIVRSYTQQLIDDFASDCRVLRVGSGELVAEAERKLRGVTPSQPLLAEILSPLFVDECGSDTGVDTIVLACTHFPLLAAELAAASPRSVHWLDSGDAIARRVAFLCESLTSCSQSPSAVLFTAQTPAIDELSPALKQFLDADCQFVDCP